MRQPSPETSKTHLIPKTTDVANESDDETPKASPLKRLDDAMKSWAAEDGDDLDKCHPNGQTPTMMANLSSVRLAIVTPMANERATAVPFVKELLGETTAFANAALFVVFDHKCTDGTRDVLNELSRRDPRLNVIWAPESRSVVDAYLRGYHEALLTGFEWILEIDAGYSHLPSDFKNFLPAIRAGYDCVFGTRFGVGGSVSNLPISRRLISRGGSLLTNILLGTSLTDMTSGYQMFSREALEEILGHGIESRGHFFQTEMKFHARTLRAKEVPIHYQFPSDSVNMSVLRDAFRNLMRLFASRLIKATGTQGS